jgi:hypothetical protein
VSQLKPFRPDFTLVFAELPKFADLTKEKIYPKEVLQRRLVKKGNKVLPQALIKWTSLPPEAATWEDWYVLQKHFPGVFAGGPTSSEGGQMS